MPIFRSIFLSLIAIAVSTNASAQPCAGDCDADGTVGVGELIRGVRISLGEEDLSTCTAMDGDGDGSVRIGELIAAVRSALDGCVGEATFADVQAIFTQRCAFAGCHGGERPAEGLDLTEGLAFAELINVEPTNANAVTMGFLRVIPGDSGNSFLVIKVAGNPGVGLGDRMPRFALPLEEDEVATIRSWVDAGANP